MCILAQGLRPLRNILRVEAMNSVLHGNTCAELKLLRLRKEIFASERVLRARVGAGLCTGPLSPQPNKAATCFGAMLQSFLRRALFRGLRTASSSNWALMQC